MSEARLGKFVSLIVVVAAVTSVSLLAASPALAQPAEAEPDLRREADELLGRLDKRIQEIEEWSELQLQYEEGEDRRAIALELSQKRLALLADLDRLVENVVAQEEAGLDVSRVRSRVEPLMLRVPDRVQEIAGEVIEEANQLRLQRETVDPSKLLNLEQKISRADARTNRIAQVYVDHISAMESLGLDTSAQREWIVGMLDRRATFLGRRLELAQERKVELEEQLEALPDDADAKAEISAVERRIDGDVHDLRVALSLLRDMGVDRAEEQRLLARATGELADMMTKDVAVGTLEQWLVDAKAWLAENGARLIVKIAIFFAILLVFRILAQLAHRLVLRSMSVSTVKPSKLLENMVVLLVRRVVMLFGLLVALSQLGFQLAPLLAGLGVAGFVVGFALQGVLSNFASGLMILFYQPFDVDDAVEVAGILGKVSRMTLVSTTILTFDNQTLIVPNSKIWGDVIKNITAQDKRRVDMTFGISYEDEIPKAEAILAEIVKSHAKVLEDPVPVIKLHTLGESSVDFVVRPWASTADYWEVYWDITREVKMRFDREGISIPFPQRDVHLHGQTTEAPAAPANPMTA